MKTGGYTGHFCDPVMSEMFFEDLGIRRPDYCLGADSGSHAVQTGRVMTAFEPLVIPKLGRRLARGKRACAAVTRRCWC